MTESSKIIPSPTKGFAPPAGYVRVTTAFLECCLLPTAFLVKRFELSNAVERLKRLERSDYAVIN